MQRMQNDKEQRQIVFGYSQTRVVCKMVVEPNTGGRLTQCTCFPSLDQFSLLVALPFPKTKGEVGCKALSSTAEIKAFGNFCSLRQAVSRGLKLWT